MNSLQTVIFFCRHGLTDKPYSSDPEIDAERVLTELGKRQLQEVGKYVKPFAPVAIYASPRKRVIESAEEVKKFGEIDNQIITKQELLEIYTDAEYEALTLTIPKLFQELVALHQGSHIVCVSHQDVIEGGLRALGVSDQEASFPCKMGQMYRVVYAGNTFAQAVKLDPAISITK